MVKKVHLQVCTGFVAGIFVAILYNLFFNSSNSRSTQNDALLTENNSLSNSSFIATVPCPPRAEKDERLSFNPVYGLRALKVIKYLLPKDVVGKEFIRVGHVTDGGYVMLDDFSNVSFAYSIGIGEEWNWDIDIASRDILVHMYDHTIAPLDLKNPLLKFYSYGISGENRLDQKLITLESMLRGNNHYDENNMLLKMDVEGHEWEVFLNSPSSILAKFSQITVELHWFQDHILHAERFSRVMTGLDLLNQTHQIVWVHGINNHYFIFGGIPLPDQIEVTYVKRSEKLTFAPPKKKKRSDFRNDKNSAEFLMWWLECGKDFDIDGLIETYRSYVEGD